MRPTQKSRTWVLQKSHAARAANQNVEPESGRRVETQMSNLVNGVVTRSLAATDATNDRVGTCGTKLLNGFKQTPVAGRSTTSLPVRAQFTTRTQTWQARMFLPRKGPSADGWSAPEKLDAQTVDNQHWMPFQFLGSLHPVGRGWGANQSPEPTAVTAAVAIHTASRRWLSFLR
jgi:hypothetical protein